MKSGVYTITNKLNNKIYIGYSNNLILRKCRHFSDLRKDRHHCPYLQRSFNKHGEINFEFSVLELYPEELLTAMENYWYNILGLYDKNKGYNIALVDPRGKRKISQETKDKMSKIAKDEYFSGKRKAKKGPNGRVISSEQKERRNKTWKENEALGKHNPIQKKNCMKWALGRRRKVLLLSLEGKILYTFDSNKSAAEFLNVKKETMYNYIRKSKDLEEIVYYKGYGIVYKDVYLNQGIKAL